MYAEVIENNEFQCVSMYEITYFHVEKSHITFYYKNDEYVIEEQDKIVRIYIDNRLIYTWNDEKHSLIKKDWGFK